MSDSVALNPQLKYQQPIQTVDGDATFVGFKPVSGTSFSENDTIKINIQSPNEVLDPRRSYLKYRLRLTGGATTAGNVCSVLGGGAVLREIQTELGGVEVERIARYNVYLAALYARAPNTQKDTLSELELYANQDELTGSADKYSNGRYIVHAPRIAALESNQFLPLPFIRGGMTLNITLDDWRNLVALDTTSTGYTVDQVEMVCCMIKPSDAYLRDFSASLASGNVAKVPMSCVKHIRWQPTATASQNVVMNIGYLKSLRSVIQQHRLTSIENTESADAFNNFAAIGMKSYHFEIGSARYPKNRELGCQNVIASGAVDPESLMQGLISIDNSYPLYDAQAIDGNTQNAIIYNWSTAGYGSGVPVVDGQLTFVSEHNSAQLTTTICDVHANYDCLLKISASDVMVDARNLA